MVFLEPLLLILAAVSGPALVAAYFYILHRKKREAIRYPSLLLVKPALQKSSSIRRYIPPIVFALGILVLLIGVAKPETFVTLPHDQKVVMLVVDVSGSMKAKDVLPSRFEAEKIALKTFIMLQDRSTYIGIIPFSTNAFTLQAPTVYKDVLLNGVDRLQIDRFTAIGEGIMEALHDIFPKIPKDDLTKTNNVGPASYKNATIILMTDGENNSGIDAKEAAHIAASNGVKVHVIGFGSHDTEVEIDGQKQTVSFLEPPLIEIAEITHGTYSRATNADEIKKIYRELSASLITEHTRTEITVFFDAAGTVIIILALFLSLVL